MPHPHPRRPSRRVLPLSLAAITALALIATLGQPAMSAAPRPLATRQAPAAPHPGSAADVTFDSRARAVPTGVGGRVTAARQALGARLGSQGVIAADRMTGTLRFVGRLDGFLTRPSARPARTVALDFVRANRVAMGLTLSDLRTLRLRRDYVDALGTHHLFWVQRVRGIEVFQNGLEASVDGAGRLVNVSGSPVHAARPNALRPRISASAAIALARAGGGAVVTDRDARDTAELRLFATGRGSLLAWETVTFISADRIARTVIDALTGATLYRSNFVKHDSPGSAQAWPLTASDGVPNGGGALGPVTFPVADGTELSGNNAHAWADVNDDDEAQNSEEVPALAGLDWSGYAPALSTTAPFNCSALRPCSWDPTVANSWRANLQHNVVQVYYFVNRFHDHLAASPISFTEAAGNFQLTNGSGQGESGDPVLAQAMDGANTDHGFPDGFHIDNANMGTLPDGESPIMQMYLFVPVQGLEGLPAANGGDDAEVVYHEYTHGLSNRLVITPDGAGALNSAQSGAMGEGWSDWYAMDFLNDEGYKPDHPGDGNLIMGFYTFAGLLRESATDCPVGSSSGNCGTPSAGNGGYTYGDFGKVIGSPEVHADGEIWTQTLWQLRDALGTGVTEGLVTRAMELSPPEPSFLDMRNSILQADLIASGGSRQDAIWNVFAERGMGYFAAAVDGSDTAPVEDFSLPPDCSIDPCGTIHGKITNKATGKGLKDVSVYVAGLASGFGNDLGTKTAADGTYLIEDVPFNDAYPAIVVDATGYERSIARDIVVDGDEVLNRKVNRDWAALEAGAKLVSFTPPDYTPFGCGPSGAFDLALGAGWGSDAPRNGDSGVDGPRKAVVKLPKAIKVQSFGVASSGTCGDGPESGVKGFTIQTRTQNGDWITVVKANAKNDGELRTYEPKGPKGSKNVRFIRFIMRSTHGDALFMDVLEVTVRGK
ncbi:MAG: M36 family metallopeptidase [Actinomycetota bacterium]